MKKKYGLLFMFLAECFPALLHNEVIDRLLHNVHPRFQSRLSIFVKSVLMKSSFVAFFFQNQQTIILIHLIGALRGENFKTVSTFGKVACNPSIMYLYRSMGVGIVCNLSKTYCTDLCVLVLSVFHQ